MRKRWLWVTLCFVAVMLGIVGGHWQASLEQPPVQEVSFRRSPPADLSPADLPPADLPPADLPPVPSRKAFLPGSLTIDADRLWADLATLSVLRFSEGDRQRTRDYLAETLQAAGWVVQYQPFDSGINLYAERPGTDPDAGAILVGAHYDTVERSPGADDNATAVAATLEVARVLGNLPTPRTLKVVFFDQEEAGLVGSFAWVDQPGFTDHLHGAVILEMLGYACHTDGCQSYPPILPFTPSTTRGDFIAVIGDQGHPELIDSFVQVAQSDRPPVLTLPVPLLGPLTPDLLRSDHAPFWSKGIGAVMVTDTANFRNPHYHQPTDLPDTLDRPFYTGVVQLVVEAIAQLLTTTNLG